MRIVAKGTWLLVMVALGLGGCAGSTGTTGTAVAVTDVASVAGKWSGLIEMVGSRAGEDALDLTIDKSGAYEAVAARTIGVMDAKGTVIVSDGKIMLKGERGGQATATLYAQPPARTLVIDGKASDGRTFSARLRGQP